MENLSIIINSCDKYCDAWTPFFVLLHKFWKDVDKYDIYLNTETKKFEYKDLNVKVLNIKSNKKNKSLWSARLITALKHIKTDYVLFFLEDFFIQSEVNTALFYKHLEYIQTKNDVGVIYYVPDIDYNIWHVKPFKNDLNLEEVNKGSSLRINAQAAIWKKDYLLKILLSKESPWDFEKFGSRRSDKLKYKVLICNKNTVVFNYHVYLGCGYGINGAWHKKIKIFLICTA